MTTTTHSSLFTRPQPTLRSRVYGVLTAHPGQRLSAQEIQEALDDPDITLEKVRNYLANFRQNSNLYPGIRRPVRNRYVYDPSTPNLWVSNAKRRRRSVTRLRPAVDTPTLPMEEKSETTAAIPAIPAGLRPVGDDVTVLVDANGKYYVLQPI